MDRTHACGLAVLVVLCIGSTACRERGYQGSASDVPEWSVGPTPLFLIGGADDRPDYLLYGVVNAVRLSDGRVAVALRASSEVKYFDRTGRHLTTVGGDGDGPGEFRAIFGMVRTPGDSLVLLSRSPGLTWLGPTGEYERSSTFDIWSIGQQPCRIGEGNWFPLPDGTLLAMMEDNFGIPGCPESPASPWRQTALVGRQTPGTEQFDTIVIVSGTERNSRNYRVYGVSALMASGPDRIYVTDTASDSILVLSYEGDTIDVMSTPFPAELIPRSAKTADVRRFTRGDGVERVGSAYDYPETYPRAGRLLLDAGGNLWVMAYPKSEGRISSWRLSRTLAFVVEAGGARWLVLDSTGEVVAQVHTPAGLFPLEIGEDYLLGVSKDEYDVESVKLFALTRQTERYP